GHTERLPHDHRGLVGHSARRRLTVEPTAFTRDEETHLDRRVGLAKRVFSRLPRLGRDEHRNILAMLTHQERDLPEDIAAAHDGRGCPCRLRGLRFPYRQLDVRARRPRNFTEGTSGRRIHLRERLATVSHPVQMTDLIRNPRRYD